MNAIQIKERVDFYLDITRNARFSFLTYAKAVNDAIEKIVNDQFGDINNQKPYSFDFIQQVKDNFYTLIKVGNPSITTGTAITNEYGSFIPNHVNFPTDYYIFISLDTTIDGIKNYARPLEYNQRGPVFRDSFRAPSNKQAYYLEDATGLTIYRGSTGTLSSVDLTYVKEPATYSIGNESLLINAGAGVLTTSAVYIAVEESVHNGITRQPGDQFTAANTNLTSGQVILASNTTTCDLPEKIHEEVAKTAAAIMAGVVSDFNRSAFVNKEATEG